MTDTPGWDNLGFWDAPAESYTDAARALARRLWNLSQPSAGSRVLDVGSGFGAQLGFWRELGASHVSAFEPDPARAASATVRYADDPNIAVECASAEDLRGQPGASYDAVLVLDALYHFGDRTRFFADSRNVLVPDGRLAFSTVLASSSSPLSTRVLRALAPVFEMPDGIPFQRQLEAELSSAGFDEIRIADWTQEVLGGFVMYGYAASGDRADWRRRARVAMTRRGCRAASLLGLRYVGVAATLRR